METNKQNKTKRRRYFLDDVLALTDYIEPVVIAPAGDSSPSLSDRDAAAAFAKGKSVRVRDNSKALALLQTLEGRGGGGGGDAFAANDDGGGAGPDLSTGDEDDEEVDGGGDHDDDDDDHHHNAVFEDQEAAELAARAAAVAPRGGASGAGGGGAAGSVAPKKRVLGVKWDPRGNTGGTATISLSTGPHSSGSGSNGNNNELDDILGGILDFGDQDSEPSGRLFEAVEEVCACRGWFRCGLFLFFW